VRKAHPVFLWTLTLVFPLCASASAQQNGGAHHPVVVNPWVQLAKLTASDLTNWVGLSVSISGDTLVVGQSEADIQVSGSTVYVFVKPSSGWANMTQVAKLTGSDSPGYFGNSVSISGDTVVVGSPSANGGAGAAYVYVKPASGWKDCDNGYADRNALDGANGNVPLSFFRYRA